MCIHAYKKKNVFPIFPLFHRFVQAGLIRTDSTEFFIEPLERGQQETEARGRAHVVYRRSAIRQDLRAEGRGWSSSPSINPAISLCANTVMSKWTKVVLSSLLSLLLLWCTGSLLPCFHWKFGTSPKFG